MTKRAAERMFADFVWLAAEHASSTWPANVKWWDDAILPALQWAVERTLA